MLGKVLQKNISRIVAPQFYGRGVVILGGGLKYFINAYLNVKLLRYLGCNLPIEWFFINDEITDKQREILGEFDNLQLIQLNNLPILTDNFAREGGGWQSKFFALCQSSFEEVLYVDADSFAIVNPEFLFQTEEYKKFGILTWYDGFDWSLYKEWFNKDIENLKREFSVSLSSARTFETGQLVLNKNKCWQAILFARELNRWWHKTYEWSLGDKEALYIGCEVCKIPYFVVPRFPDIVDDAFVQYAPDCLMHIFSHCFRSKWDSTSRCKTSQRILPESRRMEEWCGELVKKIL